MHIRGVFIRRLILILIPSFAGIIISAVIIFLSPSRADSPDDVQVRLIGMTNSPTLGPMAALYVTNTSPNLVLCAMLTPRTRTDSGWTDFNDRSPSGLGYLEYGDSLNFTVPVPDRTKGPWRVPVVWKRQNLTKTEAYINLQHRRILRFLGKGNFHRDGLLPLKHISFSPDINTN